VPFFGRTKEKARCAGGLIRFSKEIQMQDAILPGNFRVVQLFEVLL
jgi:hypothetical protein